MLEYKDLKPRTFTYHEGRWWYPAAPQQPNDSYFQDWKCPVCRQGITSKADIKPIAQRQTADIKREMRHISCRAILICVLKPEK